MGDSPSRSDSTLSSATLLSRPVGVLLKMLVRLHCVSPECPSVPGLTSEELLLGHVLEVASGPQIQRVIPAFLCTFLLRSEGVLL